MSIDRSPQPLASGGWRARPFGSLAADLEIAIAREAAANDRAASVTALLAGCVRAADGRGVDVDTAWDWTLNQRLQALIAIRLAEGEAVLDLQAACAQCGETMALSLNLGELVAAPAAPRFRWQPGELGVVELRLPTGRDVQRWRTAGIASARAMVATLVEAVAGEPVDAGYEPPEDWLPALDDAFEAHDPLTALRLQTGCPECGHASQIACDLESLLLAGFARTQARLLDDVVRLAWAFHWTEAEILSLPRWRRAHYLRQLEAGAGP